MTAKKFAQAVLRATILKAPLNHKVDISSSGYYLHFRVTYRFQNDKEGFDAYSWEIHCINEFYPWLYPFSNITRDRRGVHISFSTEQKARENLINFFQKPTALDRILGRETWQ